MRGSRNIDYTSADLSNSRALVRADITAIPFAEGSFDLIFCSHVLEHVQADRAAMRECFRVLAPGGYAVFAVPISGEITREDPTVTDPEERRLRFGQNDHVRVYGSDIARRLQQVGFVVTPRFPLDVIGTSAPEFGIPLSEPPLYVCGKVI
jgi:ubiquinone/menaquinone biosynthesis C-methylase UbiE